MAWCSIWADDIMGIANHEFRRPRHRPAGRLIGHVHGRAPDASGDQGCGGYKGNAERENNHRGRFHSHLSAEEQSTVSSVATVWRYGAGSVQTIVRMRHRPYRRKVCRQWMYWSWVRAWPVCTQPAYSRTKDWT
jgi:hypothetical protein